MSISRFLVSFRWVFFWGAATAALGLLLVLGLGFNLQTSPGWQLALYYLMLFVFVLGPVITAVPSALPLFPGAAGRVDWLMVALFALVMAGVLLFGWLRGWVLREFAGSPIAAAERVVRVRRHCRGFRGWHVTDRASAFSPVEAGAVGESGAAVVRPVRFLW